MALLNSHADPFAQRPGHTLAWHDARVTLRKDNRCILHGVSGAVLPHKLTCLMGHSGAGKTTLLNLLAGKLSTNKDMIVENHEVTLDGVPINPNSVKVKRKIAFVAQRDSLLATATPQEAIQFSATLRLSRDTPQEEIDALVNRILLELRLESVADNIIGGDHFCGLSGGEMRRVSLGVELVVRPSIVLLDEVTSGLDSHNAKVVMEVCKSVAQSGAAVIMTIHQPSSTLFELMDQVVLLSKGRCLYSGPAKQLPTYFKDRGYKVKDNYNPADWAMEVSQLHSIETLQAAGFTKDFPAVETEQGEEHSLGAEHQTDIDDDDWSQSELGGGAVVERPTLKRRPSIFDKLDQGERVSWWKELQLQLLRDMRNLKRDSRAMMLRFVIVILGSCLISIVFQGVASTDFRSHVGATFFLVLVNIIALQIILLDFIDQRPLFIKEYSTDHFRMPSYCITKALFEALSSAFQVCTLVLVTYWSLELTGRLWYLLLTLFLFTMVSTSMGVLLASATKDPRDAKELIPITILPQLLLCGFFVNVESFPSWLQWAQWLMPLTYTFRLVIGEEFRHCLDDPVLMCMEAFERDGGSFDIYSENSTLRIPETGEYVGRRDIEEYFAFFNTGNEVQAAGIWNYCALEGTTVARINHAEDGFCDVSYGHISQGQTNPAIAKEGTNTWFQVLTGGRLRIEYDSEDVSVTEHDLYFGDSIVGPTYTDTLNNTAVALSVCQTLESECPSVNSFNGFTNQQECLEAMTTLPPSRQEANGMYKYDSNSTFCRMIHGSLAAYQPEMHCPHVSFAPFEDLKGRVKCGESSNIDKEALFGPEDMEVFTEAAHRFGFGNVQDIALDLNEASLATCDPSFGRFDDVVVLASDEDLEESAETALCRGFLEAQNATGENETYYWMALLGFFVLFRGLGLVLLRSRVK